MLARIAAAMAAVCLLAGAEEARAGRYENARFGYVIEIPPGFSDLVEADNSDGGTAVVLKGDGRLAVWGANLLDETFVADVRSRIASDASAGWTISYQSVRRRGASWSGWKGERIAYSRAVTTCGGQAAYFRLEYDRAAATSFDRIAKRMAKSLKATGRCL